MSFLANIVSWLFGPGRSARRMEKIYLFARDREASAHELINVLNDDRLRPILNTLIDPSQHHSASTEEWRLRPGETESAAMERVAKETALKHPGHVLHYFPWPDDAIILIVMLVTTPQAEVPVEQLKAAFGVPVGVVG